LSKREQENKDKQERAKAQRKDDNEMKKALQKIENEHNVARHQKELELQAEIAKAKNNASDRAQLNIQLKAIMGKHEQAKKEAEKMFKFDKVTKKDKLEARLKKKKRSDRSNEPCQKRQPRAVEKKQHAAARYSFDGGGTHGKETKKEKHDRDRNGPIGTAGGTEAGVRQFAEGTEIDEKRGEGKHGRGGGGSERIFGQ
jgi:hypothetical protein